MKKIRTQRTGPKPSRGSLFKRIIIPLLVFFTSIIVYALVTEDSDSQQREIPVITFHRIPIEKSNQSFTVTNFNGSLVWAEQELSGSPIQTFRKKAMPPIHSKDGLIRVQVPFGTNGFFLEGNPVEGEAVIFKFDK